MVVQVVLQPSSPLQQQEDLRDLFVMSGVNIPHNRGKYHYSEPPQTSLLLLSFPCS